MAGWRRERMATCPDVAYRAPSATGVRRRVSGWRQSRFGNQPGVVGVRMATGDTQKTRFSVNPRADLSTGPRMKNSR